ncbi:hypothetical protein ACFCZ1_30030 [Streptomyces sp. NPDC056224]|uniref:hypothetical protein n=1 Tax=Streptomyces sp. NPDC056224 TaxID=3345750 RepID=UPI0035E0BA67
MTASADSATAPASLWRHRNFRRYLAGQTTGVAGSSITSMALPVLAVLDLDATAGQVAWLAFLGQLPPAQRRQGGAEPLHLEPEGNQRVSAGRGPAELSWSLPTAPNPEATAPAQAPAPNLSPKETRP